MGPACERPRPSPILRRMRKIAACLLVLTLVGCVSTRVRNGAAIGAASGAALGAGVGLLVSEQSLLGSEPSPEKGDLSLPTAESVASGALIGAVFGGIVGSMVGHAQESDRVRPPPSTLESGATRTGQDLF